MLRMPIAVVAGLVALGAQARTPAQPIEPVTAILAAFASHDLVAFGEGARGSSEPYAFRLALIGDPRFADTVNDTVVETGNARYQDRIDAYVRGEDVPRSGLEAVWLETTQNPAMTSSPVYEGLFVRVREITKTRDAARRLRVLLADPSGEWRKVPESERRRVDRDSFAAAMIRREVVDRKRRALLIYGDGHLPHRNRAMVVGQLEAAGSRVFNIWTTTRRSLVPWQPDVLSWTVPSFALVRGTTLGPAEVPMWFPEKLEGQFDAVMTFDRFTMARRDRVGPEHARDAPDSFGFLSGSDAAPLTSGLFESVSPGSGWQPSAHPSFLAEQPPIAVKRVGRALDPIRWTAGYAA